MKFVKTEQFSYDADFFNRNAINVNNFIVVTHYPNSFFFIKDLETRLVFANRQMLLAFGGDKNIIGMRNIDFVVGKVCEDYTNDDNDVMQNGVPILDKIELSFNVDGKTMSWRKTSKYPLRDLKNNVIGLISISVLLDDVFTSDDDLSQLIDYMKANSPKKICVEDLAKVLNLSVSALERNFKKRYNMSPIQYLNFIRVNSASILLINSTKSISEIAYDVGFYDQSYLCKNFKKIVRLSPKEYRAKFSSQ